MTPLLPLHHRCRCIYWHASTNQHSIAAHCHGSRARENNAAAGIPWIGKERSTLTEPDATACARSAASPLLHRSKKFLPSLAVWISALFVHGNRHMLICSRLIGNGRLEARDGGTFSGHRIPVRNWCPGATKRYARVAASAHRFKWTVWRPPG